MWLSDHAKPNFIFDNSIKYIAKSDISHPPKITQTYKTKWQKTFSQHSTKNCKSNTGRNGLTETM